MRAFSTPLLLLTLALAGCGDAVTEPLSAPTASRSHHAVFPDVIALPAGFFPEGIAFGRGTTFYVGSLSTGAIFRGDARTGTGELIVEAQPGVEQVGMKYDHGGDRLFVAGGFSGEARVYDASTGDLLATYQLAEPGTALINDLVLTRDAVYVTNSSSALLYRIPLGPHGELPDAGAVQTIPLTGDFELVADSPIGNANGIVATPNEKQLIIVNTTTGKLYLVDASTGESTEIDLGEDSVADGDGLLLIGNTLYVVQGGPGQIAVVRLSDHYTTGEIERVITSPDFQFPSTIAAFGSSLYVVNPRFDVAPGPDVTYQVVRVSR